MEVEEPTVETVLAPIATPLAGKKLTKKLFKLIRKGSKAKTVRRGVKEVVKIIKKKKKGILILAGDTSPIDVISHLPVFCEENKVPYIYIRSMNELAVASATKRPTSCILALANDQDAEYKAAYEECAEEIKASSSVI